MTGPHKEPRDKHRVELDLYGLKASARPGDLGEEPPATMREALRQMRGHLVRILAAPTRLVAETLEGLTRFVRGTSTVPGAIATRIQQAHARSDHGEDQRQEAAESDGPRRLLPNAAEAEREAQTRRLEAWLARVRGRLHDGNPVDAQVVDIGDGRLLVLGGTPRTERALVEAAAAQAMRQLASANPADVLSDSCVAALQRIEAQQGPYVVELTGAPAQLREEADLRDLARLGYISLAEVSLREQAADMTPFIGALATDSGRMLVFEISAGYPIADAQSRVAELLRSPHHVSTPSA
jgi:hypothetical protein